MVMQKNKEIGKSVLNPVSIFGFAVSLLLSGCFELGVDLQNNFKFEGIVSITSSGNDLYEFVWERPTEYPKSGDLDYEIHYLGSISQPLFSQAGFDLSGGTTDSEKVFELEHFIKNETSLISNQSEEIALVEIELEAGFMHAFQVIPNDTAISYDDTKVFLIPVSAVVENIIDWNFDGIRLAELNENGVYLEWDPPTGAGSINQAFVYEIYKGQTFSKILTETEETNYSISFNDLSFEKPKVGFGVRAVRKSDLIRDKNQKILMVKRPAPLAFTGLAETDLKVFPEERRVKISWESATDAIGEVKYNIYLDRFFEKIFESTTEKEIIINELAVDRKYYIGVRAEDSRGEDNNISYIEVVIPNLEDVTPPIFDGIDKATALSKTKILVEWRASPSPDTGGYYIYYTTNLNDPIKKVDANQNLAEIEGLKPGLEYEISVRAFDLSGNLDTNSKSLTVRTLDNNAPSFPGILSVTSLPGTPGENGFLLKWDDATWNLPTPADEDPNLYYEVYRWKLNDKAESGKSRLDANLQLNSANLTKVSRLSIVDSFSLKVENLQACHAETPECKRYCFLVRAKDSRRSFSYTDVNQEVLCAPTVQPKIPTFNGIDSLNAAEGVEGFTKLVAKFPKAEGSFDGYRAFWKKTDETNFNFAENKIDLDTNSTEITIPGLIPKTDYDVLTQVFQNKSDKLFGDSENTKSAKTLPSNPKFEGIASIETLSGQIGLQALKLNWVNADGAHNRYKIFARKKSEAYESTPGAVFVTQSEGELSYTYGGLTLGTEYCFYAQASYSDDPSDPASEDVLISNGAATAEKCATVAYQKPVFTSINTIETSSITSAYNKASLKITYSNATGLYNRYYINVGTALDNISEFAVLDSVGNVLSGTIETCVASTGSGCIILKGLENETNYFVTMHVGHSLYPAVKDDVADNIKHPAQILTAAKNNLLELKSVKDFEATTVLQSEIEKLRLVDNSILSSNIDHSTLDSFRAFQLLNFQLDTTVDVSSDLSSFSPTALVKGTGYDTNITDLNYGHRLSVLNQSIFGSGSFGDFAGFADLNQFTTSNGRFNIFATFSIEQSSVSSTQDDYVIKLDTDTHNLSFEDVDLRVGDEVFIYFAQWNTNEIKSEIGKYQYAKITELNFPNITIDKPIRNPHPRNQWGRYLQILITKVPHLKNFTITGNSYVQGYHGPHWSIPLQANEIGGLIVARVNGTTDLNGYALQMSSRGYTGSESTYSFGSGQGFRMCNQCPHTVRNGAGGGTPYNGAGAGGAGGGNGGRSIAEGGLATGTVNLEPYIFFGGGGGYGSRSGYEKANSTAGDGGGIIILFSKITKNGTIAANGAGRGASDEYNGAGGGGSIWLTSLYGHDLNVKAKGGSTNGSASKEDTGGAGGGGRIRLDLVHQKNISTDVSGGYSHKEIGLGKDGTVYFSPGADLTILTIIDQGTGQNQFESLSGATSISDNLDNYFNHENRIDLVIESLMPSSSSEEINSLIEVDQAKIEVEFGN